MGPFPPFRGGIQHFNTLLYESLGRKTDVTAINLRRQYPGFLFPGTSQYDSDATPDPAFSLRLLNPIAPWSWRRTANYLLDLRPELLIYKYWMPFFAPALGSVAKRLRKSGDTQTLCIIDNLTPHEHRPGDEALNRYLLRHTDHFICMSGIVEQDLLRLKPDASYRKTPHPPYVNFGPPQDKQDARHALGLSEGPIMLYFGFIRGYKGVMTLLDALPAVVEQVGGTTIIAGEFYEDKAPYLEKIKDLNLGKHLLLADHFIPDEQVNLYFSAADVLVLPYRSATQSGIVSIAQHYDLPCIVTDVGGLPEMVQDGQTGLVVPADDPAGLAQAIIIYFKETDQSAMRRRIAAAKGAGDWDAFTRVILDLGGVQE